jgi:hypothetical protein
MYYYGSCNIFYASYMKVQLMSFIAESFSLNIFC